MANEKPNEEKQKLYCDTALRQVTALMLADVSAPMPMIIDRMVTYAVAIVVANGGSAEAIGMLRLAIEHIENGVFDHIEVTKTKPAILN